jgi:hypothetical protein
LKDKELTDRLENQAKARAALIEKAKQKDPSSDPEYAARQQARAEAARRREERELEARRAKEAEREKQKAERAARAVARAEQERLAAEAAAKAAEEAAKNTARQRRVQASTKPASLGLADLKAALESRGK